MSKDTTESFIIKATEKHGLLYNYKEVVYIKSSSPVKILCNIHNAYFMQSPNSHLNGRGCPICGKLRSSRLRLSTTDSFVDKARTVHGELYDYSCTKYETAKAPVKIACKKHGMFLVTPDAHLTKKQGCICCTRDKPSKKRLTTAQFIQMSKDMFGGRFDYTNTKYTTAITEIELRCKECGTVFYTTPNRHMNRRGRGGCLTCKNRHIGQSRIARSSSLFKENAIAAHDTQYDYSKVVYCHARKNVEIICGKHGSFFQSPNNHLKGQDCPTCVMENMESKGIQKVRSILDSNNISYVREYRFEGCRYKRLLPFDFYVPNFNSIIEFDGEFHYVDVPSLGGIKALVATQRNDMIKNKYCQDNNIPLLRIAYFENVEQKLTDFLKEHSLI